jgi:peroxidase family protein
MSGIRRCQGIVSISRLGHVRRQKGANQMPRAGRSPCPGLNVMANHGYLPRSGKDIDLASVRSAVTGAYNYASTTFDSAFEQAVAFNLTTTGNPSTFNLADLAKHDAIEFDGSLSRNDFFFGDNLHYDPAIWATMAQRLRLHETGGSEMDRYVTVEMAAKARAARVADAKMVNPTFNASENALMGSPGTTALYLVTMWDDKAGAAPKAWVRSFFGMSCFSTAAGRR